MCSFSILELRRWAGAWPDADFVGKSTDLQVPEMEHGGGDVWSSLRVGCLRGIEEIGIWNSVRPGLPPAQPPGLLGTLGK